MSSLEHQVALAKQYKDMWFTSEVNIDNDRNNHAKERAVSRFAERVAVREDTGADLTAAWLYLVNRVQSTERLRDWGFLETSLVCDTHRVMFEGTTSSLGMTPPGELSNRPRYCNLGGNKRHWYPVPNDMNEALASLLDRYNARYDSCSGRYNCDLFRASAWLLAHFLALHPFADGNGRLAQIVCSYVFVKHHPFPVPVCDSNNYLSTLFEAQTSGDIDALAVCVAQGSCDAWEYFMSL